MFLSAGTNGTGDNPNVIASHFALLHSPLLIYKHDGTQKSLRSCSLCQTSSMATSNKTNHIFYNSSTLQLFNK